jgi:AcrR family transcriptional regulator
MKNRTFKTIEFPKSQEKAEKILTGATAEFLANGYAATSMDRVAIVSGVSKATVYKYFKDKRRLFEVLIEKLARAKLEAVKKLFDSQSSQEKPEITLSNIATKLLSNIGSDRNFQNLMRIVVAESGRSPHSAVVYLNNFAKPAIDILTVFRKKSLASATG